MQHELVQGSLRALTAVWCVLLRCGVGVGVQGGVTGAGGRGWCTAAEHQSHM